jgi:hypothetical protein
MPEPASSAAESSPRQSPSGESTSGSAASGGSGSGGGSSSAGSTSGTGGGGSTAQPAPSPTRTRPGRTSGGSGGSGGASGAAAEIEALLEDALAAAVEQAVATALADAGIALSSGPDCTADLAVDSGGRSASGDVRCTGTSSNGVKVSATFTGTVTAAGACQGILTVKVGGRTVLDQAVDECSVNLS